MNSRKEYSRTKRCYDCYADKKTADHCYDGAYLEKYQSCIWKKVAENNMEINLRKTKNISDKLER